MNTTIVTAFIDLYKHDAKYKNKSLRQYLHFGNKLIQLPIPKIVFIEEHLMHLLSKNEMTKFIPVNFDHIWLMNRHNEMQMKTDHLRQISPEKDTTSYLILNLNKTEWTHIASEANPYNTQQFMWLDFGVYHICNDEDVMTRNIFKACRTVCLKNKNKIYIPSCQPTSKVDMRILDQYSNPNFFLKFPCWFFCGGTFIGHRLAITMFRDRVRALTEYMLSKDAITWEVNVWFLIFREFPQLFHVLYGANHNQNMLEPYTSLI